jgi:hypothetical protein
MQNILLAFEFIALGCSFFLLHPKNSKDYHLIILAMLLTCVAESVGYYLKVYQSQPTTWVYNISVPCTIIIYATLLGKFLSKFKIHLFTIAYSIFCILNLLYFQTNERFCTYNYIIGALFLATLASMYLIELVQDPKYISLVSVPMFWIASGIMLLYIPKSILYSVFEYLVYNDIINNEFGVIFFIISSVLGIVFFSLISIACTCKLIFKT